MSRPSHTSGQASFPGSHPTQPPKVLTGGPVIQALEDGGLHLAGMPRQAHR